jgi:hypothetical protein
LKIINTARYRQDVLTLILIFKFIYNTNFEFETQVRQLRQMYMFQVHHLKSTNDVNNAILAMTLDSLAN